LIAERRLVRLGIRAALEAEPRFRIVAEAVDADSAVGLAKPSRPDICLIGRDIPGGGINAVEAICQAEPAPQVIVIASTESIDDLLASLRAGAVGYLLDTNDAEGLRKAVFAVLRGESAIPRSLVRLLTLELRAMKQSESVTTVRETQVLEAVRRGETTADIADQLGISPVTVRRHISGLVRKLGAGDRAGLTRVGEARYAIGGRRRSA
jgi:DNA-binding NarL/FixJ family response regulator